MFILLGSSNFLVESSRIPLACVTNKLGPAILSGLGFTVSPTPPARAGEWFGIVTEAQLRMEAPMILLASCVGLTRLVWA